MNDGPILDILFQTTGSERKAGMMFDSYLALFYRSAPEKIRQEILDWLGRIELYELREIFERGFFEFVDYREDKDLLWNHQQRLNRLRQDMGEIRRVLYLISKSQEAIDAIDAIGARRKGS